MRVKSKRQKEKISLMAVLLAACCVLSFYFHDVLEIGNVFTHFFYVPIILASLWWKRKGLAVALFLAVFLIFSDYLFRDGVGTANDYFRALMFVAIGSVAALLSERIAKQDEGLRGNEKRIKAILTASPVGVCLFINRKLDWANKTFYDLVGYEQGSLIGQDAGVFYPDDEAYEQAGRELYEGTEESGATEVETVNRHAKLIQ